MKKLATALGMFSGASVISTVVRLIKGKFGAVLLGASGVGLLSQLIYLWNLLHILTGLGFYSGLVRRMAECHSKGDMLGVRNQLTSTVVFLTLFSIFTSIIGCLFSAQISHLLLDDYGQHKILISLILTSLPFAVAARVYRGLLSSIMAVTSLIKAQIIADVLSLFVFIFLIISMNLTGAVIAFVLLHIVKLIFFVRQSSAVLQSNLPPIQLQQFSWVEIRHNLGYGVNGLLRGTMGVFTILTISRWIIDQYGITSNGIFSVAWKIATVYLGALYASAGSYYFPVLSACDTDQKITQQVNDAISLYMYIIPPIAASLMLGGELLIAILFSSEFSLAAVLLLLILPGDIFRVSAETVGLTFLAQKKLVIYIGLFFVWATMYLFLAWYWLPNFGLIGVALAYAVSHVIHFSLTFLLMKRTFLFTLTTRTSFAMLRGLTLVSTIAMLRVYQMSSIWTIITGLMILLVWFLISLRDKMFMKIFLTAKRRILTIVS